MRGINFVNENNSPAAAALSDDQVISAVNEFFIPVEINVTTDGFPSQLPAMKLVEGIYNSNWRNEFGFASCLALDSEGKMILGTSAVFRDIKEVKSERWD